MFGEEAEREQFFEAARLQAQREYEQDATDVQALIRWGGALLELAHFKQGSESKDMIQEAITLLKKATDLDPERPDAEWCLGNAYTSLGFLQATKTQAMELFNQASQCFKKCQEKDPANDQYIRAAEMCEKAPEFYDEIQTHIQMQSLGGGEAAGAGAGAKAAGGPAAAGVSDFWWDVGGWMLLGGVVIGAFVLARSGSKAAAPA